MNPFVKRLFYAIVCFFCIFGSIRLYYSLTDDFRISNITYEFPFETPWQVPILAEQEYDELAHIIDQNFFYMGKGAQCYAFGSADQKYVLKFFKFKHLKPNWLVDILPPFYPFDRFKQRCVERKKRKLVGVFNGYDLAYREHRQDSQILYLHLIPTQNLNLQVSIYDKIGLKREINLDDVVFLIQRKGETLRTRLHRLLNQNHLQEAKDTLSNLLAMYISEYQKGIYDHDHGVMHNTGFIADEPFHLDVGKLNKDDRMRQVDFYKKDFQFIIWKIVQWVNSVHPQYHQEITTFLAQEYQDWTGDSIDLKKVDSKTIKKALIN